MDDNQLIKNWHTRASDEDYFSKYVFEYLAFIGYLKRVKFTNEDADSRAIRRLKHDEEYRDQYLPPKDGPLYPSTKTRTSDVLVYCIIGRYCLDYLIL